MFDATATRAESWALCRSMQRPVNLNLPYLEEFVVRPEEEIVDRALTLSAVVYCAYGYPKKRALDWLERERLRTELSPSEVAFLESGTEVGATFKWHVQRLYAFAWVLSMVPSFGWQEEPPDTLIKLYPDIPEAEDSSGFRAKAHLRSQAEILKHLDEAYCLDWGWRESMLQGHAATEQTLVVSERRYTLEWCMSDCAWDEVPMDT